MARRSPGDIAPKTQSINGVTTNNWSNGIVQTQSHSEVTSQDYRPSFPLGGKLDFGKRKWILPTTYSHSSREVTAPASSLTQRFSSSLTVTTVNTAPPISNLLDSEGYKLDNNILSPMAPYNLKQQAISKALSKIADNKAGIGEDLATYMQTVRLFKDKGSALKNILNAFKDDKVMRKFLNKSQRQTRSISKHAATAYLEYVYAWKPLISDIYGIYELLQLYSKGIRPIIISGRGSGVDSDTDTVEKFSPSTSGATFFGNYTVTEEKKVVCKVYGKLSSEHIAFRILNQAGLLNPASVIWEAVPWSFVVDWFVPIGPVLNSFSAPAGVDFISGTISCRTSRTFTGEFTTKVSNVTGEVINKSPSRFRVVDELYGREVQLSWPFATPYIDTDPFRGDRSLKALALGIADLYAERRKLVR